MTTDKGKRRNYLSEAETKKHLKHLAKIFSSPRDEKEMQAFMADFFSPSEIRQFAERWYIVDLLFKGLTQRAIKEKLNVSISKVSRGSYVVQTSKGGWKKLWEKINSKIKA